MAKELHLVFTVVVWTLFLVYDMRITTFICLIYNIFPLLAFLADGYGGHEGLSFLLNLIFVICLLGVVILHVYLMVSCFRRRGMSNSVYCASKVVLSMTLLLSVSLIGLPLISKSVLCYGARARLHSLGGRKFADQLINDATFFAELKRSPGDTIFCDDVSVDFPSSFKAFKAKCVILEDNSVKIVLKLRRPKPSGWIITATEDIDVKDGVRVVDQVYRY